MRLPTSIGIACTLAALGLQPALAQTKVPDEDQIDDIVVTAQRRSERIQDVPISVVALSGEQLARSGVTDLQGIAALAPGLTFANFSDLKLSPTSIRGVIADTGSGGQDPSIATYVDDVFLGGGVSSSLNLYDIERVEVLEGPQGTLFGRNAIGGVINIRTKRPTDQLEGYIQGSFGNYDAGRIVGAIGGPLAPSLNARIAGTYSDRRGYTYNAYRQEYGDDRREIGLRGELEYAPGTVTRLLFTADFRRSTAHPKLFETQSYSSQPSALLGVSFAQLLQSQSLPLNTDPYDRIVYSDLRSQEALNDWGVSLQATSKLGGLDLTSITAFRRETYSNIGDTDMSPLRWLYDGDPEKVSRFSQEIRVASTGKGKIDWLAGIFYFNQASANNSFIRLGADLTQAIGLPLASLDLGSNGRIRLSSVAPFASATWHMTDQLSFTAGARYTHETKRFSFSQIDPIDAIGGTFVVPATSKSWSAVTPSFNIQFKPSHDVMLYASATRGFKSGGFNDGLGAADGLSFDPEYLWSYEVGAKSSLLNHHLQVNVSGYYGNWTNIQLKQDDPATPGNYDPRIINGGSARIRGFSASVVARPTSHLEMGGTVNHNLASFTGSTVIDTTTGPVSLSGLPVARSPRWSGSLYIESNHMIGAWELGIRGEYNFQTAQTLAYEQGGNSELRQIPFAGLVNGRISLSRGPWSIGAWGRNLTNRNYRVRLFDLETNPFVQQQFINLSTPRTYGLDAQISF